MSCKLSQVHCDFHALFRVIVNALVLQLNKQHCHPNYCFWRGFYHSATLNTHGMKEGEKLWETAKKIYTAFASCKNCNRHFLDMADLNFLMCKAIDNPGLTPSSSLRTALLPVFEEPVIDDYGGLQEEVGVEDYMGCASSHGIGPSIAILDTVRDGWLDCVCVYPSPLHSREQMQEFIDNMKSVLVEGCNSI
ncbi:hypothetical protein NC651_016797 [Populus alba x Populus x berolinensis]|nr:hypothetical protein NC651_016797 [Populus alba x Populus x berolinensis]